MTKLSISVATTSSTLRRTRSAAGNAAVAAPASAGQDHRRDQRPAGQALAGADEGCGHGAGEQLSFGADVPEPGAKGDRDREPGETSGAALTTVSTRLKRLPTAPVNKAR